MLRATKRPAAEPGPSRPGAASPLPARPFLTRLSGSYYFAIFSNMTRVSSSVKGLILPLAWLPGTLVPGEPEAEVTFPPAHFLGSKNACLSSLILRDFCADVADLGGLPGTGSQLDEKP